MQLRILVLMHVGNQRGRMFEVEARWVIKYLEGNELRVEGGRGWEGCGNRRFWAVGSEMERLSSGISDNPK